MNPGRAVALVCACAALLGGCDANTPPPAKVRPVLSAVAEQRTGAGASFAGQIAARYSVSMAFRVLGRVMERNVKLGDTIAKGDRLAALDPLPFDLVVKDARAGLANATAQFANAVAIERRNRILREQNHVSPQQLEAAQQAREAAEAAVAQARSQLDKALEQRGYAELGAEFDGVVTAVDTEVGQVVAPGQPVIAIARPDLREAVIDVPDDAAASLKEGSPFEVALLIAPSIRVKGRVREIAPRVDALTHSQRVKIALDNPAADFRLGANITAFARDLAPGHVAIPQAAVFEQDGKPHVWLVDPLARTVSLREVTLLSRDDAIAVVASGVAAGDRVVTAGLHSLAPGRLVRLLEEAQQ